MPLPTPQLDDRDFRKLLEEATSRLEQMCPEWTDTSPSDPGMVLLELFAHLTETMIYRLNRVPDKAFVEFLRLLGVTLRPPAAASVRLRFTSARPARTAVRIPSGTRVAVSRSGGGDDIVFTTSRSVTLEAGAQEVEAIAFHCEVVAAEDAGRGTGLPGQWLQLRRPPIIAPSQDGLDLVVGVEATADELDERVPALQHQGVSYRVWKGVRSFTNLGEERHVYLVDRMAGRITFAPALRSKRADGSLEERPMALAEVPAAERRIRVWYRRGGGPRGNVAAGTLTVLKDPLAALEVTNPEAATGGSRGESLENALLRGPQDLHSLERAVTARDFEMVALESSGAVARAKALTKASLWTHARPGTVEILLVPSLPQASDAAKPIDQAALEAQETDEARHTILEALESRRPLGTTCLVSWARYKTVRVQARVVVFRQEDPAAVQRRVMSRLRSTLSPLPEDGGSRCWPFGQALRVSHVYDILLAEPGVSYADRVRLLVDDVPAGEIHCLTADRFQPSTWFAGCGEQLYRTLNGGDGWERVGHFTGQEVQRVEVHPTTAGLLAAATQLAEAETSQVHISDDCGETWSHHSLGFRVHALAWTQRDSLPVLLLATGKGLYELSLRPGATPVQVLVVPSSPDLGFYAVTAAVDIFGAVNVALASQETGGVYLSTEGGKAETFRLLGLAGEDVRTLAVQTDGPRLFLWAGLAAVGDAGKGCFSWELRGSADPPEGWRAYSQGWQGGSCHDLAFIGSQVLAGCHTGGVLRLDASKSDAAWQGPTVDCGLPLRDAGRFQPIRALAADPEGRRVMAGAAGVVRSLDGGVSFVSASSHEFLDKVTLPPTWLACSGEHDIDVVSEDEASED